MIDATAVTFRDLLRGPFSLVWLGLIGATLLSWYLGADHGVHDRHVATTLILIVAFVKVRFVGLYFMELRDAPRRLRALFEMHCAIVCTAMVTVYFVL
ncbi:heme/copper-type cytochrome/quinol oxidase subunit 4 [Mycolicibacterium sp. BK634]|uniref:cytochrome C oxidase subunit IV family protein n=1 Tax=Mycobacteriaceae TaxID=1762 RepID=UPI00105F0CF9|nr:heme/copper-type cytochrome/quinol oxidase subunit 4 [Mycolicibacterium sp. BK634]TDO10174.1 cytochrome c oxidase subunit IV [Mycobacterium sp. BK086]